MIASAQRIRFHTLLAFAGDDLLYPRGSDSVEGGAHSFGDTVSYDDGSEVTTISVDPVTGAVTGGSGSDTVAGIEHIERSQFADTLKGSIANNSILGRAGNDTIQGRGGDGYLVGDH